MNKIINIRAFNRALVANRPICFVCDISAAGLMAGTVPTIGIENCSRKGGTLPYSRYYKQSQWHQVDNSD